MYAQNYFIAISPLIHKFQEIRLYLVEQNGVMNPKETFTKPIFSLFLFWVYLHYVRYGMWSPDTNINNFAYLSLGLATYVT